MQQDNQNTNKQRKSEAQKTFEEADNAGRFAGDDTDAQSARHQAEQNIRQDAQSSRGQQNREITEGAIMDGDDVRPGHANMMEEEAQNINKDRSGSTLTNNEDSLEKARNKATQGIKEGRDTGSSDDRSRNSGSR